MAVHYVDRVRSRRRLAASIAASLFASLWLISGCTNQSAAPAGGPTVKGTLVVPPSSHDAAALTKALSGKVLVAKIISGKGGRLDRHYGFDGAAFYGADGKAYVVQGDAAGRPELQTLRWAIQIEHLSDATSYTFLSVNGRPDGATLQYDQSVGRIGFSDAYAGPYFSFAVIQDCWPSDLSPKPPVAPRCSAAQDAATRSRLAANETIVRRLRAEARGHPVALPRVAEGAFTTTAGSVFENSYGNVMSVTQVDGRKVEFRDRTGESFESYGMLFTPIPNLVGNDAAAAAVDRLWPLAAGKSAHAWVYNGSWAWDLSWKVVGKERVTVPAGTFEAWRIEHTEESLGHEYVAKSESWYAPAIGWNVRYRSWIETPRSPKVDEWVLTTSVSTVGETSERGLRAASLP